MELSKEEQEAIETLDALKIGLIFLNSIPDANKDEVDIAKKISIVLKLISKLQKENEKQGKVIDETDTYCRKELAFKRRLERDNRTPDLFNQGRFGTCEDILEIINRKVEEDV